MQTGLEDGGIDWIGMEVSILQIRRGKENSTWHNRC